MANRVIQAVLKFRDDMSKGLLGAARNAKKAGANINSDMMAATKKIVAFKNKTVSAFSDAAKAAAKWAAATSVAMAGGLLAMDSATEEYRVALGKLNTAFEAAGLGAEAARQAYSGFYDILGDTDTATEASQLLAKLALNVEDISVWTRIAAGVSGTFGDSLPIEGLIEATNETAKVGQVTGVLADALNWVGISEDDFNAKLEACSSEAERNALLMDTLAKTYDSAAESFYKNNKELVTARANHRALMAVMSKLGQTSAILKNSLANMFGFDGEGGIRAGSIMDFVSQRAESLSVKLQQFQQSGMIDTIAQKLDSGFAWAVETSGKAIQFLRDNADKLIPVLKGVAAIFVATKVTGFVSGIGKAAKTVSDFTAMLGELAKFTGLTGLGKAFGGVSSVLGAISSPIKTLLSLPGKIRGLAGNIGGVLSSLGGFKTLGIAAVIAGVVAAGVLLYKNWDTVKAKAIELWGQLKSNLAPAFDTVKNVASQVAQFFTGTVVPAASALWGKVKEVASAFVTAMAPAASVVLGIVSQLASFFVSTVVPAIVSVVRFAGQLASTFLTVAAPAIDAVMGVVGALADVFSSVVAPAIGLVATVIAGLANVFSSVFAGAVTIALNIVRSLAEFFTGVLKSAIDKVRDYAQKLSSFFTGTFGPAFNSVKGFAQKLSDFLSGKLTKAIDAVKSAFNHAKDSIQGLIDKIQKFLGLDTKKTVTVNTVYNNNSNGYVSTAALRGNASGTPYWRGGLTWVNERGGEIIKMPGMAPIVPASITNLIKGSKAIVNLPSGTKIIPHDRSLKMIKESFIGHNAMGSGYWHGGLTEVNERGGEIVQLPGGKTIMPESLINQISNSYKQESRVRESGSRKINITVNSPITINGNADEKNASKFVDIIARELRMALENYA